MENNQTPIAGPQRVPWNKGKLIGVRSLSARRRCSSTDGRGTSGRSSYAPGELQNGFCLRSTGRKIARSKPRSPSISIASARSSGSCGSSSARSFESAAAPIWMLSVLSTRKCPSLPRMWEMENTILARSLPRVADAQRKFPALGSKDAKFIPFCEWSGRFLKPSATPGHGRCLTRTAGFPALRASERRE